MEYIVTGNLKVIVMNTTVKHLKKLLKKEASMLGDGAERLSNAADDIAEAMELLRSAEEALDMEGATGAMDAVGEAHGMLENALTELQEFIGNDSEDEED